MTTAVQKSQIIKSIDNLHLKGTIDKGLEKNSQPLFSSFTNGAINISEVGLYQVIDTMIEQLLDIKNKDKIIRRVGSNVSSKDYYTTSLNRYSLKNREKQLYDVLQKAPIVNNNNTLLDLSNNIDGSASSTDLTCKIVYKDTLFSDSDGTPINADNLFTEANLKSNEFISLQTPTKYNANGVRISGEKKFVLRYTLSGGQEAYDNAYNNAYNNALASGDDQNQADNKGTTAGNNARNTFNNQNNKYFYRATDNCIEFLRETDTDTTINNLILALKSVFGDNNVVKNATSKTITITQSNTDGIIIDNISLFTNGIQLPIQNFRSFRYKQFFANTISKTSSLNTRGNTGLNDTRLSLLIVGYDSNGIPVKKYSEDALFEFFGKMTYEFIKLNNNHIGADKYYPGSYINASGDIGTHHLNSVKDFEDDSTNNINRNNIIKQLHNIKKNGSFGSVGFNNTGRKGCVITYDDTFYTNNDISSNFIPHLPFVNPSGQEVADGGNFIFISEPGDNSLVFTQFLPPVVLGQSPTLNLDIGTYRFIAPLSGAVALRLYTTADRNSEYIDLVDISQNGVSNFTTLRVTIDSPDVLYYGFLNHPNIGGIININKNILTLYDGTTPIRFILSSIPSLPSNTAFKFERNTNTQTTMSNLTNSINQYSNFDATHDSSKNRIIVTQIITKGTPDNTNTNTINNLTEITLSDFYLLPNQFGVKSSTLREQYGYFPEDLFNNTSNLQNIPYKDDDPNAIGLYQIINNLIYQLQFFKKKIKKKEKELIRILKDSSSSSNSIDLDSNKVNNLQALTSYCRQQGGLHTNLHKPSFVEIINTTDYTGSDEIDYRYSQDALYELCGRWLNELLKLNNGHSGYENIYPGFFDINKTFISQHHLNSVTTFTQL